MKVTAIQHDIVWEDGEATRRHLAPMIAAAAAGGARLVALTEMYATGFSMHPERIAEEPGGPNEQFLIDQARTHGVWMVASIAQKLDEEAESGNGGETTSEDSGADDTERAFGPRAENVAILVAPDGTTHRYRKIHPFSYGGEDLKYRAGSSFCTVEVEGLRVSLFICYDLRFADEFWSLAPTTDLYVVVANWPAVRREHWRALLVARAIENQAYVVGVNRVGSAKGLEHAGDSAIIDPRGQTLAEASGGEALLTGEITSAEVARVRNEFRFLPDRR